MECSFKAQYGKSVESLRKARKARLAGISAGAQEYLSEDRWKLAAESGHETILMSRAVDWLFRRMYFESPDSVSSEVVFLSAREVQPIDTQSSRTSAMWLVSSEYFIAAAALGWCRNGVVPLAPLASAADCFYERFAMQGAQGRTATEFIADATRAKAEIVYDVAFVCRALLQDWSWIVRQFEPGFGYLLNARRLTGHGAMIAFSYRIALFALRRGELDELAARAREALWRCVESLAASVISQEPWDRAAHILYLCGYAFERTVCSRLPSVSDVNRGFLGELNET